MASGLRCPVMRPLRRTFVTLNRRTAGNKYCESCCIIRYNKHRKMHWEHWSNTAVFSSSYPCINFDTMTRGPDKVRRIDAGSTEWLWYWEDEFGKWNMYASPVGSPESDGSPVSNDIHLYLK